MPTHKRVCRGGWIDETDVGITCTRPALGNSDYCKECKERRQRRIHNPKPKRVVRESTVANRLRAALKDPKLNPYGIIQRPFFSMAWRGMPDRLLLCPGGVCVFVELKRPGGKTTALQEREHAILRSLGFDVYVTSDPVDLLDSVSSKLRALGME